MPPHEHMYDYSYHVISGSTLAVFSGEDGSPMFTFAPATGETLAFKRNGTKMVDTSGVIPPFDAIHGVKNAGQNEYREILIETKPCESELDFTSAPVRRLRLLARDGGLRGTLLAPHAAAMKAFGIRHGSMANHASETAFAQGFTAAIVATFASGAARDAAPREPGYAALLAAVDADAARPALEFDYHPVAGAVQPPAEGFKQPMLRHALLVKFNLNAPVGALAAEYAALPLQIPEMQAFEWGPVSNALGREALAGGFEYAFVTTLAGAHDRDAYLVHPAHGAFAAKIFAHIDQVVVVDFYEEA